MKKVKLPKFDYKLVNLREIEMRYSFSPDDKDKKHPTVRSMVIQDQEVFPTQRFWGSICSLYGFGPSIFHWFRPKEVFERIVRDAVKEPVVVKVVIEDGPQPQLLAVATPDKQMISAPQLVETLRKLPTQDVSYQAGIITSQHNLRRKIDFNIGGDVFEGCSTLETPVDGYGLPMMYVSMYRARCTNLLAAQHRAFRTGIILGKAPMDTLRRVVESYNNEDGFITLKERLQAAQMSWASVWESATLARTIYQLSEEDFDAEFTTSVALENTKKDPRFLRNRLLDILSQRTGDLRSIYGVAQIDSISEKRMRQLPSKAKVYDLINFATEISTYQLQPEQGREFKSWVGQTIASEYDLEGSVEVFKDFDSFLDPKVQAVWQSREKVGCGVGEMGKRVLDLEIA